MSNPVPTCRISLKCLCRSALHLRPAELSLLEYWHGPCSIAILVSLLYKRLYYLPKAHILMILIVKNESTRVANTNVKTGEVVLL